MKYPIGSRVKIKDSGTNEIYIIEGYFQNKGYSLAVESNIKNKSVLLFSEQNSIILVPDTLENNMILFDYTQDIQEVLYLIRDSNTSEDFRLSLDLISILNKRVDRLENAIKIKQSEEGN